MAEYEKHPHSVDLFGVEGITEAGCEAVFRDEMGEGGSLRWVSAERALARFLVDEGIIEARSFEHREWDALSPDTQAELLSRGGVTVTAEGFQLPDGTVVPADPRVPSRMVLKPIVEVDEPATGGVEARCADGSKIRAATWYTLLLTMLEHKYFIAGDPIQTRPRTAAAIAAKIAALNSASIATA